MNTLQPRTECVTRTPASACLPLPRCYKRLGQAPSQISQLIQLRRASGHAEVARVGVIVRASASPSSSSFPRHLKVPEQQPFWKQLAKTTLFLPALVAAALCGRRLQALHSWHERFWKSQPAQPARQEKLPQSTWQAAEATAVRGAERWQRTLDSTSFRTAAVVLSFFSMLYVFFMAFQDAPPTPVTLGKIQSYKQMLAEQQEPEQPASVQDAPASSETQSRIHSYQELLAEQQRPAVSAKQPARRSRIAEAIQHAAGRSSRTPSARQSNIGLTPQQFTTGMEMPTPTRPVSVAARDPHRPAAVRDQPFTPAPIRSYSASTATPTRSYAPSVPYTPSLAYSLSTTEGAPDTQADDSTGTSAYDTVDIPAEDTPSAASMGEKVKQRAQEIRESGRMKNAAPKNAKAAAEPADVDSINDEPVTQAHASSQNGAGRVHSATETVDLPDSQASSTSRPSAFDTVDIPAEDTPPAAAAGQRVLKRAQAIKESGRLKNAASKAAKAAAEPADLKSINVKPLIQMGATYENGSAQVPQNGISRASQNGVSQSSQFQLPSASMPSENGKADSSQSIEAEMRNNKLVREMLDEIQQADDSVAKATAAIREPAPALLPAQASTPAPAPARRTSGDSIVRRLWSANPLGEIFDGIVGRKQAEPESKHDMLWNALQSSTARNSKYDAVYALLHSAAMEADWGAPKSGPAHDLLHLGDSVSTSKAERRPAPGFLTKLLKIEETQSPTPRKGLMYKLLHIGDRIGNTLEDFKSDFRDIVPQRADPLGKFLDTAADITDWEPMKWDPIAQLINGALSHTDKRSKYDIVAAIDGLEASSPIKRPSKYDPLPGFLNAEPSRSRPAMDPFAGILGLVLAHSNSRAEARAKRAAQSVAPAAANTSQATPGRVREQQPPAAQKPVTKPAKKSRIDVKIHADQVGERVPMRKWEVRYPFSSNGAGKNGASNGVGRNGSGNGVSKNGVANGWPVKEKAAVSSR